MFLSSNAEGIIVGATSHLLHRIYYFWLKPFGILHVMLQAFILSIRNSRKRLAFGHMYDPTVNASDRLATSAILYISGSLSIFLGEDQILPLLPPDTIQ